VQDPLKFFSEMISMGIRKRNLILVLTLSLSLAVAFLLPLSCHSDPPPAGETTPTVGAVTTGTPGTTGTILTTTAPTTTEAVTTLPSAVSSGFSPEPTPSLENYSTIAPITTDDTPSSEGSETAPSLPSEPGHLTIREIYDLISPAVVSVRVSIPATALYEKREEVFSGTMIDESGLVITSYSLMERALDHRGRLLPNAGISILVKGAAKSFSATLAGHQSATDLALLKIQNPEKLAFNAVPLAKEPALYVGTPIVSIGYPPLMISTGGLSTGYVTSVYRRTIEEDGAPIGLIETNIATMPIYAGAPLVNLQGEVVAIVSGYLKRIYVQNQGYAVPSPIVADVIERIQELGDGAANRKAALGIAVLSDEEALNLREQYDYPNGLYISAVKPESAAYTAGLNQGDILMKLNGETMEFVKDLMLFIDRHAVGTLVEIVVYRPSEEKVLTFTSYLLEDRP